MDPLSLQTGLHLLVAALAFLMPGAALYLLVDRLSAARWLNRGRGAAAKVEPSSHVMEALLVAPGLSIAAWPLLLLYLSLMGVRFTPLLMWSVLAVSTLYTGYRVVRRARKLRLTGEQVATAGALIAMTLLSLFFRVWDIKGLVVPLFGDSLHHTMVATIISETGLVPTGYQPFVPVDTFTYHFGFHTLVAVFAQLTASGVPYSVLMVGQVLIVLAVPASYLLNSTLFGSRLAGLGAALLTGFVSLMPSYYVNWGRYTQLCGQVLVVIALALLVRAMDRGASKAETWKHILLCAICVGGLVVVHYRILVFFGLFGLALGAWQLASGRGHWRLLLASWGRGLASVLLGLAIGLPWIVNLVTEYLPGLASRLGSVTSEYLDSYNNLSSFRSYLGIALPALAVAGVAVALSRFAMSGSKGRERLSPAQAIHITPEGAALVVLLWAGLLVAALWAVPGALGSYTVAIAMYMPFAALGGYAIGTLLESRVVRSLRMPSMGVPLAILAAGPVLALLLGTWHVVDYAQFNYLQPADRKAFDWIAANTPPDAKFLISSQFSYAGRGVTASDAGMWLPLIARRNVSVPALSSWMEHPVSASFFTDTKQLAAYTQPKGAQPAADDSTQLSLVSRKIIPSVETLADPTPLNLMKRLGVTYVYSGASEAASKPRFDLVTLRKDSRHYKLIYFADGVYIFKVEY